MDSSQLHGLDFSSVTGKLDILFNRVLEKLPMYLRQNQTKLKLGWIQEEHKSIFASLRSESEPSRQTESAISVARSSGNTLQLVSPRIKKQG